MTADEKSVGALLDVRREEVLGGWIAAQLSASTLRPELLSESELRQEPAQLLDVLRTAGLGDTLSECM